MAKRTSIGQAARRHRSVIAGSALVGAILLFWGGSAGAVEIPTGNEDLKIRWDNTFRYSLTQRLSGQNKDLIGDVNIDDGNRNFNVGIVQNRIDILSELDVVLHKNYGIRLSGAGWYDQRYHDSLDNTSPATSNHLVNGVPTVGMSDYAKRIFAGPSGELLDAFVFGNFDIGDIPLNVKVGRHSEYWGESLLTGGLFNGVAYGQAPLDFGKALMAPGVEGKEVFRPLNNISIQSQITDKLSIAAQYFLQWEETRLPEAGTYMAYSDLILKGSESLILGPGVRFSRGNSIEPKQARDWGLSAKWSPALLEGGALGVYYRNFSDKLPQVAIDPGTSKFHFVYPSDIHMAGVSLSKVVNQISIGSEFSYRWGMPLSSAAAVVSPGGKLPDSGETLGTRGDTMHAVVNLMGVMSTTPLFDSATWLTEFTWNHWNRISQGEELFSGRAGYNAVDAVTKDSVACGITFAPVWFAVFPNVDITTPMSFSMGLIGNSAVVNAGSKNSGNWGVGIAADIFKKYKASIDYADYFGTFSVDPATRAVTPNGTNSLLKDRGMLTFTLKTTF